MRRSVSTTLIDEQLYAALLVAAKDLGWLLPETVEQVAELEDKLEVEAQSLSCDRPALPCLQCGLKTVLLPPTANSLAHCIACDTWSSPSSSYYYSD